MLSCPWAASLAQSPPIAASGAGWSWGTPPLALVTHIVEEVSPPFHGDALENSQHCEQDVVELSDPVVGPFPVGLAFGPVGAGAGGLLGPTWSRRLTLNVICEREGRNVRRRSLGRKR